MGKLSTPDWIREGYGSKVDWEKAQGKKVSQKNKGKVFRIRVCPECGSEKVSVVLVGEEGKRADNWQCSKCKWKGRDINIKEVSAEELIGLEE